MTNYINSITLEDGSTYNIGPFKIDDSSNIVYHDYSAPSSVSSNVIIGSPVLPNSSINNNIIIGNPSIEGPVSDTILIGNSNFTIKVTSSSATVNNILGVSGVVGGGYAQAGPVGVNYNVINSPGVVYTGRGPATIYGVGIASFDDGTVATVCGGVYVRPSDSSVDIRAPYRVTIDGYDYWSIFPDDASVFLGFAAIDSSNISLHCDYVNNGVHYMVSCNITIYIQSFIPPIFISEEL